MGKIKLYKHQQDAINKFKKLNYLALFFEPRTGKTLTALLSMRQKKVNYCIVIAPLNAFDSWKRDCELLGINCYVKTPIVKGKRGIYLWNYESFSADVNTVLARAFINGELKLPSFKNKELLKKAHEYKKLYKVDKPKALKLLSNFFKYKVNHAYKMKYAKKFHNGIKLIDSMEKFKPREIGIILDESHRIKNPDANSTKLIMKMRDLSYARLILSGTPIEKYEDLFTQMKFLHPDLIPFKAYWEYKNFIAEVDPAKFFIRYYKKKNIEKIYKRLKPYIITVKYHDVFPSQKKEAPVEEEIIPVNISLEEIESKILSLDIDPSKFNPLTEVNLMYKLSSGIYEGKFWKRDKIRALLKELKKIKGPVIIWTWFEENARLIAKEIKKRKVYVNTGSNKNYQEFKTKRDGVLVTTYCIKEGQDLSFCNNVIYFDLPYAYRDYVQSYNRVVNPNKKNKTKVKFLFTEFDERVKEVVLDKKSNILSHLYEIKKIS